MSKFIDYMDHSKVYNTKYEFKKKPFGKIKSGGFFVYKLGIKL